MNACSSCDSEVPAGTRWCPICHKNAVDPQIGRLASPARRLGAFALDILLLFVISFLTDDSNGTIAGVILPLAFVVFAFVLLAKGTTPGKLALGLRVAKEDGERAGFFTMFVREVFAKTFSLLVIGLGFLWIILDKENQGWHDKFLRTYVVQK